MNRRVIQVCREIGPGGGVGGVAFHLERELISRGWDVGRLTGDSFASFRRLQSFVRAVGATRLTDALAVVLFSVLASTRIWLLRKKTSDVILVHNDAVGGDVYVNHGLHKAMVIEAGWSPLLRNPLHAFLLAREEVRHRLGAYRALVCLSSSEIDRLLAHYPVTRDKVTAIPNGVDTSRFMPSVPGERKAIRESFGVKPGQIVLLFVGHEFRRKGLREVLDSLRGLDLRYVLWVVGGPDEEVARWREAHTSEFGARVRFFGARSNVEQFFRGADLFVLPSAFESFLLVGLEAMSCGVPCILSEGAAAGGYLVDGYNGWLKRDRDNLGELIDRFGSLDSKERLLVANRARSTADKLSWPVVAEMYDKLLTEVSSK